MTLRKGPALVLLLALVIFGALNTMEARAGHDDTDETGAVLEDTGRVAASEPEDGTGAPLPEALKEASPEKEADTGGISAPEAEEREKAKEEGGNKAEGVSLEEPAPASEPDPEVQELKERLELLERELRNLKDMAVPQIRPAAASPPAPLQGNPGSKDDPEEERARTALERTIIERGGLLLPPWSFEIAPGFSYTHSSSDAISINGFTVLPVLVVGEIVSERIRRDTYMPSLTLRLGLPEDLQLEAFVPYAMENEMVVTAENKERIRRTTGFSDIETAISWQFFRERGWVPDLLAGLRWKTASGRGPFGTTDRLALGTGFNGVQGTLTAVKIRDPVALFGGISYTSNIPAHKPPGRIDPGDTIGFNLGLALSFNPETSVNIAWDQRFTEQTKLEGNKVPGSSLTVGIFKIGASYILAPWISLDLSLGMGLTRDAPDIQAMVSLPLRFPH